MYSMSKRYCLIVVFFASAAISTPLARNAFCFYSTWGIAVKAYKLLSIILCSAALIGCGDGFQISETSQSSLADSIDILKAPPTVNAGQDQVHNDASVDGKLIQLDGAVSSLEKIFEYRWMLNNEILLQSSSDSILKKSIHLELGDHTLILEAEDIKGRVRADSVRIVISSTVTPTPTPTPAPDASTSAIRGCPDSGYSRLVNVSNMSELKSALSNASPGDQIRLAAGTYAGTKAIYENGTASKPITICGEFGVWPVLNGGTFDVKGDHLILTGLAFDGPNNSSNNLWGYNANHVLFTYNIITNGDWHAGFSMRDVTNIEISHNFIYNNGHTHIDHGLYIQNTAGPILIANNVIFGNAGRGISIHSNSGYAINRIKVINNTIVRNGNTGLLLAANDGVGNVIANNVMAENGLIYNHQQLRIKSGTGNKVLNNLVWSSVSKYSGIEVDSDLIDLVIDGNLISDPKFIDIGANDFHLTLSSPAIGLADPTFAPKQDHDYKQRDPTPDAGAYEH